MVVLKDKEIKEYYNYVKSQKTLSLKELDELLKKDDQVSKQKFINAYLYYVFVYAYQIYNYFAKYLEFNYSFEDFLQDGNLLLISLINRPLVKNSISLFSLYYWIKLKMVLEHKISNNKAKLALNKRLQILKARDDFFIINHREATISELVTLTKVSKNLVEAALLETPLDIESISENKVAHILGAHEIEEYVMDKIINGEDNEIINTCLLNLSEKEKMIVENVFGLNGDEVKSLGELAKEFHLSKQRIHQVKKKILKRIYDENKTLLDEYHKKRF